MIAEVLARTSASIVIVRSLGPCDAATTSTRGPRSTVLARASRAVATVWLRLRWKYPTATNAAAIDAPRRTGRT